MTRLERLYTEQRQSPWLDNLTRAYLRDGTLAAFVAGGIRGVTANPTILAKAIQASDLYDAQFFALIAAGCSVEDAYWELAVHDVTDALAVLRPTYDNSRGSDGFVSIEVAPELARDTAATIAAAARLHERIARPNLLVKIPATAEGIPAIAALISGPSCPLTPENLRATKEAPSSSARLTMSIGVSALTTPFFEVEPWSAVAENWPLVRP